MFPEADISGVHSCFSYVMINTHFCLVFVHVAIISFPFGCGKENLDLNGAL